MTAASIITLRETLEASLIVGIVLAYLQCTQNMRYNIVVWLGVLAGVLMSLALAIVFRVFFGGFEGTAEALYEGISMLVGAGLITWMILWMLNKKRTIKSDIEQQVAGHVQKERALGIFFLVLISTAREGVETVIFLNAALVHTGGAWQMFGGLLGIAIALCLSFLVYKGIQLISLKHLFNATSVILILFAAGLVAHGIHELQEAGVIPFLLYPVWDINPAVLSDGSYPIFHENGAIGAFFKGLFGYNGNPGLLEMLGYIVYIAGIAYVWRRWGRTRSV